MNEEFYYRYFDATDPEVLAAFKDGLTGNVRRFPVQIGTEAEVTASRTGQLYSAYQTGQCARTARQIKEARG